MSGLLLNLPIKKRFKLISVGNVTLLRSQLREKLERKIAYINLPFRFFIHWGNKKRCTFDQGADNLDLFFVDPCFQSMYNIFSPWTLHFAISTCHIASTHSFKVQY